MSIISIFKIMKKKYLNVLNGKAEHTGIMELKAVLVKSFLII